MELIARKRIIYYYWHKLQNYELAFEYNNIQAERLEKITLEDFPQKLTYLLDIADTHYQIKDYPKAMHVYGKILEEKDNIHTSGPKQHARNGLGLSYRYGYNDLDRSDSCFLLILHPNSMNPEAERFYNIWSGIAEGNLGHNMHLRGDNNKAISLLKSSLEKTVKDGDYAFSSNTVIGLANIYLKKGEIAEAKHYIDLAQDYYKKWSRDGVLARIYEALSKYYAATGNAPLSMVYMDSMLVENRKREEQFSALQMLRAEQRINLSEQRL